jgi:6-pyruvoyltetrahydropterin/6-carboxytetrahydropterin synthase
MNMKVSREFTFDAAHKLADHPGKCSHLHGHTYTVVVTVAGEPDESGMVIDFLDMKRIVTTVIKELDHGYLNEFYQTPTAENVAADLFHKLEKKFNQVPVALVSVVLYEGKKCWVEVIP